MTTLTASSKYTARNGKEYGMVTEKDIYDLAQQGLTYNQIVSLLNKEAVNMSALRTDIYGGVNAGKTNEEVTTQLGDYGYYDGGNMSPTEGPTKYFMNNEANKMLQAVAEADNYDAAMKDPQSNNYAYDSYNKTYGSKDGVYKSFGFDLNNFGGAASSSTSSPSSATGSSSPVSNSSTYAPPVQQYGVSPKPPSTQSKEQPYVQWDAEFGMGGSKNGSWLNDAMKDAVGVGFMDTSKGQQFENVLNSTEKKPANTAAGPNLFQTIMNSY